MFKSKKLYGISLKKCEGKGTAEIFNIGQKTSEQALEIIKVEDYGKQNNSKANQCQLLVTGDFNFTGLSDPKDPKKHIHTKQILVTLRSFRKANGMDVKELSGPAIGKIPVRMWTKELEVAEKDLDQAIKKFSEYTGEEKRKGLTELIIGGMKNGPWCLPFVLIH